MTEDGPDPDGDPEPQAAADDRRATAADDRRATAADDRRATAGEDGAPAEDDHTVDDAAGGRTAGESGGDRSREEADTGREPGVAAEGTGSASDDGTGVGRDDDAGADPGARPAPASVEATEPEPAPAGEEAADEVPPDVRSYDRFQKMDRASYDRVNEFLRDRTYITAREWAIARLCADFRTATGVEMTKIGRHLPELVPFMTDTYSPQAVNQARSAFEEKVRMAGATFLYGAMSGFFTADELDDLMYEVTEVAKFLLEVEGVELAVEEELAAEDRISSVMREVREASEQLRYEDVECPHCGEAFRPAEGD